MVLRYAGIIFISLSGALFAQSTDSTADSTGPLVQEEVAPPAVEAKAPVTVFVPEVESKGEAKKELVFPQDPRLSSFLSVTFPGLGQLYQGNYLKAFLFTGTFLASSGVIAYYTNENRERTAERILFYDKDNNLRELKRYNDDFESSLNTSEKVINVVAFTFVVSSYIWSVIDAYRSAKNYNKKHFFSGSAHSSGKIGLKPYYNGQKGGSEVVYRF